MSSDSPSSPCRKPDLTSALSLPPSRQSSSPAKPRIGRSSLHMLQAQSSTLASSSRRSSGGRKCSSNSAPFAFGWGDGPAEGVGNAIEDAVDESARLLRSEFLRELNRLVQNHLTRKVIAMRELPSAEAQDIAVHAGHAFDTPVGRRFGDSLVERRELRMDPAYRVFRVQAALGVRVRPEAPPE